jgi:O-antigen ligase
MMAEVRHEAGGSGVDTVLRPTPRKAVWIVFALLASAAAAYLIASGFWYVVLALLLIVPGFVVLHRYPLAVVTLWLVVTPLVVETSNDHVRKVFWLVHRGLPVITLTVVLLGSVVGARSRALPKLGWPEIFMAGYVVATLVSISYTSEEPAASAILLFDRVVVPMCLYLIVRLLQPDERDLRWLVPAVVFVLLTQSLIGVISWTMPGALPSDWLGKLGERTVGSLRTPDVFGTTVVFCGLFLIHGALNGRNRSGRVWAPLVFILTVFMIFMTFSRGNWLAGTFALLGTLLIYRRFARSLVVVLAPVVVLAFATGALAGQMEFARERFLSAQSEESALSRLPVVLAAVRMFEAKPLLGWGYESFDRFDREFQRQVGELVYPEKDHASHNSYLTILAEQGLIGFLLFLGPAPYWLYRSISARARLPATGLVSRKLLWILWLVIVAHVVVNNFSRMQVPFGLGMFWLTLGLIASLVDRSSRDVEASVVP